MELKRIPALAVVENDDLRESVRYNLYLDGFEVATAKDSRSGLEAVSQNRPRLILADVADWAEFVGQLKAQQSTRNIPIIVLCESAAFSEIEKVFEAGADDHILKPIDDRSFGKTVREKLKRSEQEIAKAQQVKRVPVLVIDDDAGLRKLVEYNLYRDGFEIHTAADGKSGIELAKKVRPEVILLDILMPEMDGLEVLSALRYEPKTANIPVFMLTSEGSIGTIDRAYEIGAAGYITKPFDGRKFGQIIKEKLQAIKEAAK